MRRWMLALVAGAMVLTGCSTHYSYRSEAPGHYKGYYLKDGTYVKVHPTKGYVQGYVLRDGRHVKAHPSPNGKAKGH